MIYTLRSQGPVPVVTLGPASGGSARRTASAILVAGFLGIIAQGAVAQSTDSLPAPMVNSTLPVQENVGPPPATAVVSAPSLEPAPAPASPYGTSTGAAAMESMLQGTGRAAPVESRPIYRGSQSDTFVPFVLGVEAHPWPLSYRAPELTAGLALNLPALEDVRLMLPGPATDLIEGVRYSNNRYLAEVVAAAAQQRGKQLAEVGNWIKRVDDQRKYVDDKLDWQNYQFAAEARQEILKFREKVASQSEGEMAALTNTVSAAISRITPIFNLQDNFELQNRWYTVMVQLKEGVALYQTQILKADQEVLDLIDQYLREHPVVAQPDGPVPTVASLAAAKMPAAPTLTEPAAMDSREPAQSAAVAQNAPSSTGGILIAILAVVAAVGWIYMKFRRRGKPGVDATDSK